MPRGDAGSTASNVVFILTDDLAWNLVPYMPHVKQMQQRGITFSNYFVTDSLCCPSRSSIFTGRFPHGTTVYTNSGDAGGYPQFERAGNASRTFAVALHAAGYKTAMMGKYLNGYQPQRNPADPGWSEWDVAGDAYAEYDYSLNQNGTVATYGHAPADYLTDVLSGLATKFILGSAQTPFAIEVATFAPHGPYTPAPRNIGQFHESVPRTPAFDRPNVNPPKWLKEYPPLTAAEIMLLDSSFNLRVEAVQAVDDLIASVLSTIEKAKIADRTYVVFSSDNGYHMGEHELWAGKETAFETDIRVPLVVVGPGVPAGVVAPQIVENIDLCPTFAEIAGTSPPPTADGHSLVALLEGQTVAPWRDFALIEHHGPDLEPMAAGDPDSEAEGGPLPNSYEALRAASSVYVEYLDGETEYYDLATDPYEITNTAGSLPHAQVLNLHDRLQRIKTCKGAAACWAAQKL
jgi:arylsulfatase A-like enzyme